MAETKGLAIELSLDATKLKSGLQETSKELKQQKTELNKINQSLKFDTNPVENLKKKASQLNTVIATLTKQIEQQKKLVDTTAKLAETDSAKYSKQLESQKEKLNSLNGELGKYKDMLQQTNEQQKKLSTEAFEKLASGFAKASAAIFAGATAIYASVAKASDSINSINQQASKAGMSIESYQKLSYAFAQVGSSAETFTQSISKVNQVLGNVALGKTSSYSKVFKQLGIDMKEFSKLSTTDAFDAIIDALGKVEDKAKRTGYAASIFGSELATKLDPIIQAGSDSLKKWGDEAVVVSTATANLAQQNANLREKIKNLGLTAIASLIPTVNSVLENMAKVMADKIVPAMKQIGDWINNLSAPIKNAIGAIAGITVALGPLLLIGTKVAKMVGSTGGIAKLGGLLGPVGLTIAAIAAAIALAWKNSEKFRESVKGLVSQVGETFKPLFDELVETFKGWMPIINQLFTFVGDQMAVTINALTQVLEFLTPIINKVNELMKPVREFIQSSIGKLLGDIIDMLQTIWDFVEKIINKVTDFFSGNEDEFEKFKDFADKGIGNNRGSVPSFANRQTIGGNEGSEYQSGGNTYYVTINTSADHMSLDELDEQMAVKIL